MKWLVLLEGKQSSRLSDRCLKNPQNHFNMELMLINIMNYPPFNEVRAGSSLKSFSGIDDKWRSRSQLNCQKS